MTMTYYTLGNSGLRVSRLALGTMTFGTEWGWGADRETATRDVRRLCRGGRQFLRHRRPLHRRHQRDLARRVRRRARTARQGGDRHQVHHERRARQSECRRQRPQEHHARGGGLAEAARHRLHRPLSPARLGQADAGRGGHAHAGRSRARGQGAPCRPVRRAGLVCRPGAGDRRAARL